MAARWALVLVLVAVVTSPAHAQPSPGSDDAKSTKSKSSSSKKKRSKHHRSRKKPPKVDEPIPGIPPDPAPATTDQPADQTDKPSDDANDAPVITDDDSEPDSDAAPTDPAITDAPRGTSSGGRVTASLTATAVGTFRRPGPSWFVAGRVGPSLLDRTGAYDFKSNQQAYHLERNVRWEVAVGRYVSRRLALALAFGSGPYVKHDAEDPLFAETTRFDVFPWHATLGLEVHASVLVLGVAAGVVHETSRGSFSTYDADMFAYAFHTLELRRFGAIGSVHTGLELHWGHWGVELLAEASAMKLGRGTYEHDGESSPGLSSDEMGYVGSLLLGLRWQ